MDKSFLLDLYEKYPTKFTNKLTTLLEATSDVYVGIKECRSLFMISPKNSEFGKVIIDKTTMNVVCSDLPIYNLIDLENQPKLLELAKMDKIYNRSKGPLISMPPGFHVRMYHHNGWKFAYDSHLDIGNMELVKCLNNGVIPDELNKELTYIFICYDIQNIVDIFLGNEPYSYLFATVSNKTNQVIYWMEDYTEKYIQIYDGNITYSKAYLDSKRLLNAKNLDYLMVKNINNFDQLYRYFPIPKWEEKWIEILNKVSKLEKKILASAPYKFRAIKQLSLDQKKTIYEVLLTVESPFLAELLHIEM